MCNFDTVSRVLVPILNYSRVVSRRFWPTWNIGAALADRKFTGGGRALEV